MIHGLRAEITFYKDFFEKIHVQADFLQMGDFKGAAEPYLRNNMSPQFRKQFETVMANLNKTKPVTMLIRQGDSARFVIVRPPRQ